MMKNFPCILLISLLLNAGQAAGQYLDTVCVGTTGTGYHVIGYPGSTYSWTVQGGVQTGILNNDSIFVNWGNVPGIYQISVIEQTAAGCLGDLMVGSVWVTAMPWVSAGTGDSICQGEVVNLSTASSMNCQSILWTTSGDGTFSNPANLHPIYVPGPNDILTGTVILTITGKGYGTECPPVTSSVNIRISAMTASVSWTDVTCYGADDGTAFINLSGGVPGYSFMWNDPMSQTTNPATNLAPGTYTVLVTDASGCSISKSVTIIQQYPTPSATLTMTGGNKICDGDSVILQFWMTGTPPWSLTYTDGTSSITVNAIMTSPYTVMIYPANSCIYSITSLMDAHCTAVPGMLQGSAEVTVYPIPDVDFVWNFGSQNNEIEFFIDSTVTNIPAIGNMVLWNFGDGTYGYLNNPVHIYPAANLYTVILTITDTNGCVNSVTHLVNVPETPHAFFSSTSPVCFGQPVCFTDLSYVSSPPFKYIKTWIWNFGDGSPADTVHFPNNPNLCHLYSTLNTYPVTLTVIDNEGYTDSYTSNVVILPDPVAGFTHSTACQAQSVQFSDISSPNNGGSIISWNWDFGDPSSGALNTSNQQNPTHVFNLGDTNYNVKLIISNFNTCTDTILLPVYVFPPPPADFKHDSACLAEIVYFYADTIITQVDSIVSWSWDFGDGSAAVTNPVIATHAYVSTGTYVASLTVTDHHGCMNTIFHAVNVAPLPMPEFSWSTPACYGNTLHFYDASTVPPGYSGFIAKWFWDFGDGTTQMVTLPASPDVTHTFSGTAMSHVVRLTVWTNDSCSAFIEHTIITLPSPVAGFTSSTVSCMNQLVQFTDQSQTNGGGSVTQWQWNFGDPSSGTNNVSTLQNPTHTYINPGSYAIILSIANSSGCSDTIAKNIVVDPSPFVDFSAGTSCLDTPIQFTSLAVSNAAGIVSYSWDFGDGSPLSTQQNPTHTYATHGTFNVRLTVVNSNGCIKDTVKPLLVNPKPFPEFSFSSPNCSGAIVTFTDQSTTAPGYLGSIVKWVWDFNDGTVITINFPDNPSINHTFAGTAVSHNVRLTVTTSDSCTAYIEHVVNSVPSPVAEFAFPASNCMIQTVQFTDLSQTNGGGTIISWNWDFGDPLSGGNNSSILQNPVHSFSGPGSYNVTLIVKNADNCPDTIVKNIVSGTPPLANFTADTACHGSVTSFVNSSVPNAASIISYSWDFGDGSPLSTQQNPTHTYTTDGTFNVRLTVVNSNGCIKDTTKQVLVNPKPIPEFSFSSPNCSGAAVTFNDLSGAVPGYLGSIVKWVWDFNDGTIITINYPGNPNVSHVFVGTALSHNVRLTVTTSDGCTAFIEHVVNSIPSPIADFGFPEIICPVQPVQFTDQSQNNGGGEIISRSWDFGDPSTGVNNNSAAQNPVHSFSGPGSYNVTLIVSNTGGCKDTIVRSVVASALPLANFTADTACLVSATTFTNLSIPNAGSIILYIWDFGDGSPLSTLQNPAHTYTSYGIKNVKLTVTNSNGCQKDTTQQVLVNPLPIAAFSYTNSNCTGAPVHFTNQSSTVAGYLGSIVRWEWDFGDGSTQTITFPGNPDVTHIYTGAFLSYLVRLTVRTSDGCVAFVEHAVNIMASPLAGFSVPGSNCSHQPVSFTDLSQTNGGASITQWYWDFGDPGSGVNNNSIMQNPSHVFSGPGVYTITEIVYNASNCSDTTIQTITVAGLPFADFIADTVCLGTQTSFTDQSSWPGIITHHEWDFGDGATAAGTNVVHMFQTPGLHQVRLTITTQEGCIKDTTKNIFVRTNPVAAFSATGPVCQGDTVYFTDQSTSVNGPIQNWEWDFGDGNSLSINDPASPDISHLYVNSGTYFVILTVTTYDGCISSAMNTVVVHPTPVANFDYSANRCAMMPVQFTDLSNAGGGGSAIGQWSWDFDDPGSGSLNKSFVQNPVHSFTGSGTYHITLTVTNSDGCVDSITRSVNVNSLPVAQFSTDPACAGTATHFTDQSLANSAGISSWLWNFGDPISGTGNNSTLQNPTHIYANFGNYLVTLTVINSNSCIHDTVIMVTVPPAPVAMFQYTPSCVKSPTQFNDLSLAPNSQISNWLWDFGDGTGTSVVQNPSYTYTVAGTYYVKLRVTNLSGCSDSITIPIVSRPTPNAAYNYTSFFCPAGKVNFHDQSMASGTTIAERLWIFEPGSTSNLHDPIYIFPVTDTNYIVTLIVTDQNGCMDTIHDSVYVKPGFSFTFSQNTACLGTLTNFHAINNVPGDSLYFLQWNFGDPASGTNNTSTLQNPHHLYTSAGSFIVKLTATNSNNCTDSIYRMVPVNALPEPDFSISATPCDNLTQFKDLSLPGSGHITGWTWNFGDGSPAVTISNLASGDTQHVYSVSGSYSVTLMVVNSNGCSETIIREVNIPSCITVGFGQSIQSGCTNTEVSFFDQSMPVNQINQWYWNFGDGSDTLYTGFTGSVKHLYLKPGNYYVLLKIIARVNGQNYMDSVVRQVTIHPSPMVSFLTPPTCFNLVNRFHDQSNTFGVDIISRIWSFGEPTSGTHDTSSLTDPTHSYAAPGDYTVRLTLVNELGCKDSLIKTTKVYDLPEARFTNSIGCNSNPVYFEDRSMFADTVIDVWKWNFGDTESKKDTSSLSNPVYTYKEEGNYIVRLILMDRNGCRDTVDSTITVNPSPVSAFILFDKQNNMNGKIRLINKSEGADAYLWDFGNGTTSTDENPVITYANEGVYTIMLTSVNQYGCTDTSYFRYDLLFKGLYVPNAFVPESHIQGINLFKPVGVNLKYYRVVVMDSWGHLLWESNALDDHGRPKEGWNGRKSNGELYQQGNYVWKIEAEFSDGTIWEGSDIGKGEIATMGIVALIR